MPTIRPCRVEECEAVLDLWRRAGPIPTVTDDVESVRRVVTEGSATLLVAELDGAMVGTIIAGWDGWRGTIYRLAVLPSHRRRGIARSLVAAALEWHRSRGARRALAVTRFSEPHAMDFWRSMHMLGFVHTPDDARFVVNFD